MPLCAFRVIPSAGRADMELGFPRDEAAFAYGKRMSVSAEVKVWRSSEHLRTVGTVELAHA